VSALPLASPRPRPGLDPGIRRHLELAPVPAVRRRPRALLGVVTIGGVGLILLAQLLLSIVVADGAYTISALQAQARDLQRHEQALAERLEVLSSTQNLIMNAEHLGMVASGNPVFLDLTTGSVSGDPSPAGGSLTGTSGNQIGNSLLAGATPVDPIEVPEESNTTTTTTTSTTSTSTGSSAASSPGTIPSPTTR